ncbi:serine/threonine protein kinase [Piscinibacter sp.]|uniref:serine/threonine protein kinase n=1 Tax=Piscinibacter sp. TaxID=1903157 RepID=UPI002D7EEAD0|nr:serine/threonine-protein kinase [Albitalea sp.]
MASTPSDSPHVAPPAPMDEHDAVPAGTRFGELEIVRVLGVGGFGIVYLALDHALQRQVALKEYMPVSLAGRGKDRMVSLRSSAHAQTYALGLRSFINEARLLARFNHPSLVKVYRFWEENGTAYMVMPYLEGRTLRDVRHAMTEPPTEAWLRTVIDPLLDALELLHREGVYHRDIAPDNVLLPPGEAPVLLDFGAARRAIGDRSQTFTAILKPSYAPIEQYAEVVQLRQGPWTDLYALGAVVYFLLRGVPPPPATARAVQDDVPLLLDQGTSCVSPRFLAAIEWALAVRPIDRPHDVAALREVLDGRAEVPERTPGGTTVPQHRLLPPGEAQSFAPTLPLAPAAVDITQTMARPRASAGETTVMPSRPTLDEPPWRRAPHGRAWVLAGLGALAAVVAGAWLAGGQSVPIEPAASAVSAESLPRAAPALPAAASDPAQAAVMSPSEAHTVPVNASTAPPKRPAAPPGPRQACGSRNFLALAACMEQQCTKPRFKAHPECVDVLELMKSRRHAEESAWGS